MTTTTYEFEWAPAYRVAGLPFGITPSTARVEVTPTELVVRYGLWRLRSALQNVESTQLSGDYAFVKTAGPPHLSFSDRGVSFTTNGDKALCLSFHEPVPAIDPTATITHPGATLSVAEPGRLAESLGHAV